MPTKILSTLVVAAALSVLAYPAAAEISAAVKGACKNDYKRYCAAYGLNDPGLRKCMDQVGRSLSQKCVKTLVNSGEVTKARATQRWKHTLD